MSTATLTRPAAPARPGRHQDAVQRAAARLADAVAEYDAALDHGVPMFVLVKLDQEVAAATRCHRAAVDARD